MFYPDGTLKQKGIYIRSKGECSWTFYYPGGNIEKNGNFVGEFPDGLWSFYDRDGNLKSIIDFDHEQHYDLDQTHTVTSRLNLFLRITFSLIRILSIIIDFYEN